MPEMKESEQADTPVEADTSESIKKEDEDKDNEQTKEESKGEGISTHVLSLNPVFTFNHSSD